MLAALVGATLALAACSGPSAAESVKGELPDLTSKGFTSFECGTGKAIGGSFQAPTDPQFEAQCWTGSPQDEFRDIANSVQDDVTLATSGQDVTGDVCPADSLTTQGGIACRAVLVTKGDTSVLVRTVVILADPATALAKLPANPTQDQIHSLLKGADLEVLVGTEPANQSPASPTP